MNRLVRADALALLFVAGVIGCGAKQKIRYNLDAVATRPELVSSTLDVDILVDIRSEESQNRILLENERNPTVDGKALCINAEKHYASGTVTRQVSEAIRAHLEKRGAFRTVTIAAGAADYRLTGNLRRLYGRQQQSSSAKVGAAFGLIGALATAGAKTPGEIRIELVDLVLARGDGTVVAQLPDVSESFDGEMKADAYCWAVYGNVNERLRNAVERLAEVVEREAVAAAAGSSVTQGP